MQFAVVDRCPVPSKAAPFVLEAKKRSGETLQSCYRGRDARAILNANGKHDQDYLYNGWIRHLPGFNPANPPGFSTHECHNDGPAFPGLARGARIPEELVGQDWSNAFRVVQAYRAMGVNAALTYPDSVREKQHINIRVIPKTLTPPLTLGDGKVKGHHVRERVSKMTGRLSYVWRPKTGGKVKYLDGRRHIFDAETQKALKQYQHDHGLKADGVYGEMTEHQLDLSYHYCYTRLHPPKPKPPKKPPRGPVKQSAYPGIDVSNNNGDIDWVAVKKAGKLFGYVRCTEGLSGHGSEDELFTGARLKAMRHAGVIPGYYHFAHPQPGRDPKAEAAHFFRYVDGQGGWDQPLILPPMLDIEWVQGLGTKQLQSWCKAFLKEMDRLLKTRINASHAKQIKAVTGLDPRVCGIYSGLWFWIPRLGDPSSREFGKRPLWLSFYTRNAMIPPLPRAWKKTGLTILQHSDKGVVQGHSGHLDLNILFGHIDTKRLAALL